MLSAYGICDVASVVLRDAGGCWGFIDLWRRSGPFEPDDTRGAARILAISEHTLQDHLKSIFAKTRTDSRRLLIARATGATK